MKTRIALAAFIGLALGACAAPAVDRAAAGFDETRYAEDLEACRGGSAATYTLYGLGGAMIGSALGAVEGASTAVIWGDAGEGAMVGAALGLGTGAYVAYEEQDEELRDCLGGKGYALDPA